MGWLSENLFGGIGSAIGSIWDQESSGKNIGREIGKIIPFRRGGRVMAGPRPYAKGGIVQSPPPPPPQLYAVGGMVEMEKPKRKRRARK